MNEYRNANQPTLRQRIREDKITAEVTYGNNAEPLSEHPMDPWTVVLKRGRRKMTVPFWTGIVWSKEPTSEDVLNGLLIEADGFENASGFEDWCNEYGYDADSRKAEKTYKAVERNAQRLSRFLGEKYEDYLWNTARE